MIFPGFPGVLSFFQVFQVEWEPCIVHIKKKKKNIFQKFPEFSSILCDFLWLFPDLKMPSHFPRFSSPRGNPVTNATFISEIV